MPLCAHIINNIHSTTPIVLHNLIASMIGATTNNPRLRTSLVVFDRDRIFADVFEPYVFECAVAVAVHTFGLVFADDGVFEGCAGFEEEYCVGFACWLGGFVSVKCHQDKRRLGLRGSVPRRGDQRRPGEGQRGNTYLLQIDRHRRQRRGRSEPICRRRWCRP